MKFIIFLFLPIISFGQIKLDTTYSVIDKKIEIKVPKVLSKMSDEVWALKYPGMTKPKFVVADENAEINLLVSVTQQAATENRLEGYKDFRIANFKKTRADIKFLSDGVKAINGKTIAYFKFTSQASDQPIFNFYFFVVVDGKIVQFVFNCIMEDRSIWEIVADEMMDSLNIK